jgi:formate dehydrogenase subunit delta
VSESSVQHLIKMANQIAASVPARSAAARIEAAATHMKKFWSPAMTAKLRRHLDAGGTGLSPEAARAVAAISGEPA